MVHPGNISMTVPEESMLHGTHYASIMEKTKYFISCCPIAGIGWKSTDSTVSVLTASLSLLDRKISGIEGQAAWQRILRRMQRNLQRLLEMQYEIEDILRQRDYKSYNLLSTLLDVCTDELEALVTEKLCEDYIVEKIRNRI